MSARPLLRSSAGVSEISFDGGATWAPQTGPDVFGLGDALRGVAEGVADNLRDTQAGPSGRPIIPV